LDARQRSILDQAGWVCLTVGPAAATREVLARLAAGQRLCWAVKADGDAFPAALRQAIAATRTQPGPQLVLSDAGEERHESGTAPASIERGRG
jgi:electron transfer flavoprotein alpha/beta subunit